MLWPALGCRMDGLPEPLVAVGAQLDFAILLWLPHRDSTMADPWDIPPLAARGNKYPATLYAAVGRALSGWELLELQLARIYAAFVGVPPIEAIAMPAYRGATTFGGRAAVIEEAAERHFIKHPDQAIENDFKTLICDARNFASRRNDIAHGIVRPLWTGDTDAETFAELGMRIEYVLAPATYKDKSFGPDRVPLYLFTSTEINRFKQHFRRMRLERIAPLLVRVLAPRGS